MEKAQELVGQLSVTDAAIELGYDNISHFIALFKSYYGLTPGQYKKKLHGR
jgi:AraC-like DNA-binding protein